jgi:hypothetical protein
MTKQPSLPRWVAVALMEHAAWVIPAARGPWASAMQHELPHIENDLEALTWAGGCLMASYVERGKAIGGVLTGALVMQTRQWMKIGLAAFGAMAAIGAAAWWAAQRPYLTPGNHQIFREASDLGAWVGFLVFMAAAIPGLAALLRMHDRKFREAARAGRVCAVILVPYVAALALVSLLTPGTVVNIGDSYCYDLWCLGVDQVKAAPKGRDVLYTAEVRISVDSSHPHQLPAEQAKGFFYVLDDQGKRYSLLPEASFADADVTVHPGESVMSSLAFVAPRSARKLYLIGKDGGMPWVYLYFGSDISLLHRPALLRIL